MLKTVAALALALSVLLVYEHTYGSDSGARLDRLTAERTRLDDENRRLRAENDALRREIDRLTGDKTHIAQVARDELGYVRPDEIVFVLDDGDTNR